LASLLEPASPVPSAELADLRDVRASELGSTLAEETAEWRERLDWDFQPSADLVERFVGQQALSGFALLEGGQVVGYSYYVHDNQKGLIGDLYVRKAWRKSELEYQLLDAVVRALRRAPLVTRIETQLILLGSARPRPQVLDSHMSVFDRNFMRIELEKAGELKPVEPPVVIEQWSEQRQEAAAHLIPRTYAGHQDSEINDQYRSVGGARRFLHNIIQYPGCGAFFRPGSYVALDRGSAETIGISLASLVAPDVGHITQVCVAPDHQGARIGYEMLRRSLTALRRAGCRKATLTVTAANRGAVGLYERMGFEIVHRFWAFVWQGFA
jgi:ribosomal protein S18 acetylase RimI-like enzyme